MKRFHAWVMGLTLSLVLPVAGSFGLGGAAAADASNVQDITISPATTQLAAAPGADTTGTFTVVNQGDSPYVVATSVSPYHVEGQAYDPRFSQLPGTVDAADWVHLDALASRALAPHALFIQKYTVAIPAGTAPGGYYAVIFAETTLTATANSGVTAHDRVGDILYITVKGPVRLSGSLRAAPLGHISLEHNLPLGVVITNDGGVHFLSTTAIRVTNLWGKQVYHASLERYVLPQTQRLVSVEWHPAAPIGLYHVSRSATVAGKVRTVPDKWVVVVQPWLLAALGLLILFIAVMAANRAARRPGRMAKRGKP